MNCDLKLEQDFKNDDILDEIKKISEESHLLLEKGTDYQNNIKDVYYYEGVPGATTKQINFSFLNPAVNIDRFGWHYKFYDVEEKKIRYCRIWSPYDQFINRNFVFYNKDNRRQHYIIGANDFKDRPNSRICV